MIVNRLVLVISILFCLGSGETLLAANKVHDYKAGVNLVLNQQNSGSTWLNGSLGRFAYGDKAHDISALNEYNVAYRYKPSAAFQISTHLQAQLSSFENSAREIGLVELEVQYRHDLDFNQQISFKAGQFFLPTSMENIDSFWESPYTINFSSLNSWIGEEFRPIGLDGVYRYHFDQGGSLSLAGTVFGANDSMGALLAYRGWSYGRQRSVLGDVLALPTLNSLQNGQMFGEQRDDGTKPFGRDLDGDLGYALRTALSLEDLLIRLSWVDNRGDTTLLHAEYAWRTEFSLAGVSWQINDDWEFLAETMRGSSTMGAGPGVDIDFYSAYAMLSYRWEHYRFTYRFDQFGIDDRDQVDQENNELGRSHTLAIMWQSGILPLHLGLETQYLSSQRSRILAGPVPYISRDTDAFSLSFLARYDF